jgi:hypothetical protein
MMLALVFYGALAALAVWATWKDEDLRWIGWMLAAGYVVTNILYFTVPITAHSGPYTLIEVLVALAAYCAWGATGYRLLIALVAVNLASIGITVNFAAAGADPSRYQIFVFVVGTNICFAVECFLTLGVGIAHGYRTGRFRLRFRRRPPQPNAAREGEAK